MSFTQGGNDSYCAEDINMSPVDKMADFDCLTHEVRKLVAEAPYQLCCACILVGAEREGYTPRAQYHSFLKLLEMARRSNEGLYVEQGPMNRPSATFDPRDYRPQIFPKLTTNSEPVTTPMLRTVMCNRCGYRMREDHFLSLAVMPECRRCGDRQWRTE